ncbi:hypothetical protein [Chlamydia gallinacea]|uniref:Uncharacterized protein n=1 Tax=Chlamydia gallinacea 08-1274/3 TaxID=1143323 RepID=A0A173DYE6_9CHLA|nr:hypothetical protein [Chlamydia gallinacea]ANG65958.1 hypothetical protein M787_001300 [Chlamydia gallinacea 08-1274/3]AQT77952.1 hypothetical protein B1F83_04325 [Chlamydia gallinacea]
MLKILTIRGVYLLCCLLSVPSVSYGDSISSLLTSSPAFNKTKIGSDAWIEAKLRQYPELLWLAEPSTISNNVLSGNFKTHYSLSLFERKIPTLDVAIRSLIYLHLFIQGSRQAYGQLCQLQSPEDSLSFKQFQTIHKQLMLFLNSPKHFDNTLKILETAIILKYLGCSLKAVALFKPYFSESHIDAFYFKALHVLQAFPDLSPSFSRLSPEQKEVFLSLRCLADYHALFNLTTTPNSQLLSTGRAKRPLVILDLYLHALDVCGEKTCSQELYYNFVPLLSMLQQHATVEEAFSRYFTYRANRLGFEGSSKNDMVLVRLATLMELSPTDAMSLASSFKHLSPEDIESLTNNFYTAQGEHIPLVIRGLPNLISGLLQAGQGISASNPDNRLRQVYTTVLSLLIKSLKVHKEMLRKHLLDQATILDFSQTSGSCGGLDIFSENVAVRVHLNGSVSIAL